MNMLQHTRSSGGGSVAFDFSTPTAVMLILKAVRAQSELAPSVRNEIRDLIFSYTNGKGNEAVRQTIEARLVAAGITPDNIAQASAPEKASSAPSKEVPKAGFSSGRTAPSFAGGVVVSTTAPTMPSSVEAKIPTDSASAPTTTPTPVPPSPQSPKIVPTIPKSPVAPVAAPVENISQENSVAPKSGAHDIVKPVISEAILPTNQTAPRATPAEVANSNSFDTTELLERIRVIKADINVRAGNPVNLVAMDNAIGREYMSSLLEAMKQLGSGNASTISGAMKRLEIAYEQALSVIEMNGASGKNQTNPTQAQQPAPQKAPVASSAPAMSPVPPATPAPAQRQSVPVVQRPALVQPIASAPNTSEQASVVPSHNPPLGATRANLKPVAPPAPQRPQAQQPAPAPMSTQPVPLAPTAPAKAPTRVPVGESPADIMQAAEAPSAVPIHSSRFAPAKSVAMATPLRKVEELPTLAEVKNRSESGNPLYTGEITDGLEQLLSEWSIFRKSGILGTGPRGSNHPLFLKLAGLKIPLIIAGRFEGATEEVRQSITDYMNGWRYEQGIVYEKEETFENYLRRVIRHIIDVQKK